METTYHNTTNLQNEELINARKGAKKQKEIVFDLFAKIGKMTASDVYRYFENNTPITSVRRAITDLKNENILIKCDEMKIGIYGKPEHYYILATNQLYLF